ANRPFAGVLQFNQLEDVINARLKFPPRDPKDFSIKAKELFSGEEFVIVSQFGQVANALASDGLPHTYAKNEGVARSGRNETEEDVHGGGFARTVGSKETKDLP